MEKRNKYTDTLYYLALIIFVGIVGYLSLGRGFDFDVINSLTGDDFLGLAISKGIQENGLLGAWFNSRIGVPDGAALIDWPAVSNIDYLIMWIISWFTDSMTRIIYVFLILSFPLDGVAMSLLMRKLDFNREVSFVFSCLFSFAPYHFYRYLTHMSLVLYVSIPIALYLGGYIIGVVNEDKKWKLIAASVLLGSGYGYYYAFGLIVLAVSYLIKLIKLENKSDILRKLWVGAALGFSIFVGLLPQIIYSVINGKNLEAGKRSFFEQEIYGLKIINLLLPVTYSRIGVFRNLTASYISSGAPLVTENSLAGLGIVGAVGFVVLCLAFIVSYAKKDRCNGSRWELIDYLAILTLTFVLVGTIGGFGEIFNWAVVPQIRCYNRSSILLTCTSLLMVAILVNMIRNKSRQTSIIACALILFIGMYDSVNIWGDNWQDGFRGTQEMYESYFEKVESALNENAMVYQLPYMEFPEAGAVNNIHDYKLFAGYLFTDTLRWSYGSVRGRNKCARELNIDGGMSYKFLSKIKEKGFEAVYIDLDGYADGGEKILAFYDGLGVEPIVCEDGKLYVYDISEVTVTDRMLTPGYSFVKVMAEKYNANVTDEDIIKLAKGLSVSDMATWSILWGWFAAGEDDGMTDEEYVETLYMLILNRKPDEGGMASWVGAIQNGAQRERVFQAFLSSGEFLMSIGL